VRLAMLAAAGGSPTPYIAASSIIDAARHRRFAINRLAARNLIDRART
jgi:hypothetical protein